LIARIALSALLAVAVFAGGRTTVQPPPSLKPIAVFPGTALKWLAAAQVVIDKRALDREKYIISIFDEGETVIVLLSAIDEIPGALGSTGSVPGYEIEIRKQDSQVIRANYSR